MKTLIVQIFLLAMVCIVNAQNVNIPDANFKAYLTGNLEINTNADGEIQVPEASAYTGMLNVSGLNIGDLTGIEAFTMLDSLYCSDNQLTNLDVSNNTALTELYCDNNQLASIDVSGCTVLTNLGCWENQLDSLDVSNNTALKNLDCSDNLITYLNVSGNSALEFLNCGFNLLSIIDISVCTALTELYCHSNQLIILHVYDNFALEYLGCSVNKLTGLDISNNTALVYLDLSDMPTLYEVCVWAMPISDYITVIDTTGSPNVYFKADCWFNIPGDYIENSTIDIYPNPSDDIINIEIQNINDAILEIYTVSGNLIYTKKLNSKSEKIDISAFSSGVYIVKVIQDRVVNVRKVVVK